MNFSKDQLNSFWRLVSPQRLDTLINPDRWEYSVPSGPAVNPYLRDFRPILDSDEFEIVRDYIAPRTYEATGISANPLLRTTMAASISPPDPLPFIDNLLARQNQKVNNSTVGRWINQHQGNCTFLNLVESFKRSASQNGVNYDNRIYRYQLMRLVWRCRPWPHIFESTKLPTREDLPRLSKRVRALESKQLRALVDVTPGMGNTRKLLRILEDSANELDHLAKGAYQTSECPPERRFYVKAAMHTTLEFNHPMKAVCTRIWQFYGELEATGSLPGLWSQAGERMAREIMADDLKGWQI